MLADFCKHRFLLSLSPAIPTPCGGVPLGVPPDLKSGVKKRPNLFRLCGFAIRSKGVCFSFYWGDYKSPGVYRSNLFYGGFQIRRDAWRVQQGNFSQLCLILPLFSNR